MQGRNNKKYTTGYHLGLEKVLKKFVYKGQIIL